MEDIADGRRFYDLQDETLGNYFYDTLFSEIDSLFHYSGIHSKYHGYYKRLSRTFPYAIYYKMELEDVVVYRVLDCRQEPQKIRRKLKL